MATTVFVALIHFDNFLICLFLFSMPACLGEGVRPLEPELQTVVSCHVGAGNIELLI